ncbi:MAG: MBL fold metallo-hydrolase [Armatimonadota bacterium]
MVIKILPVGMLETNCCIIADDGTKDAAVIDPGDEIDKILKETEKNGFKVKQVIITHNHPDHTGAAVELKEKTGAGIYMGEKEINYNNLPVDVKLKDGGVYKVGGLEYKALSTPGHSPGSVCIVFEKEKVIFSGDTLFCRGIGRVDLPGGDMGKMENSLKELTSLDGSYKVYPGHGPETTIEEEKDGNPFL